MRRFCGDRKMRRSLSNHISSPKRIWPRPGRSRPARHRNVVVFPDPDGPNSTVSDEGSVGQRRSARIKGPAGNCFSKSEISSTVKSLPPSAAEGRSDLTVELISDFEKQFPAGPLIRADLRCPTDPSSQTVLFGPSGSGKTTTLRCLAGLERPGRGHIRLGDEMWFDSDRRIFLSPQKRRIGYLFQDHALFPPLNVTHNIAYGLGALGPAERQQRGEE